MAIASEQQYQAAISGLQSFQTKITEASTAMSTAAKDCEDNMSGDAHMAKAKSALDKALRTLNDAASQAAKLAQKLQEELGYILEAGSDLGDD